MPRPRPPCAKRLLAALLDVGPDELLGVLLEHVVDLVEDGVDVLGQLLVALTDLGGRVGLRVLCLFGPSGGLALPAGVVRCHAVPP
jgi:hypothetical protein